MSRLVYIIGPTMWIQCHMPTSYTLGGATIWALLRQLFCIVPHIPFAVRSWVTPS